MRPVSWDSLGAGIHTPSEQSSSHHSILILILHGESSSKEELAGPWQQTDFSIRSKEQFTQHGVERKRRVPGREASKTEVNRELTAKSGGFSGSFWSVAALDVDLGFTPVAVFADTAVKRFSNLLMSKVIGWNP